MERHQAALCAAGDAGIQSSPPGEPSFGKDLEIHGCKEFPQWFMMGEVSLPG